MAEKEKEKEKVEQQLKEVGSKLETPPLTKDALVKLLKVRILPISSLPLPLCKRIHGFLMCWLFLFFFLVLFGY